MDDTPTIQASIDRMAMRDLLEWAWTIIANAGGGDWDRETPEWQEAAAKWRDQFHSVVKGSIAVALERIAFQLEQYNCPDCNLAQRELCAKHKRD